jgi:hypothetical protein
MSVITIASLWPVYCVYNNNNNNIVYDAICLYDIRLLVTSPTTAAVYLLLISAN